jgi:hypothetical protein
MMFRKGQTASSIDPYIIPKTQSLAVALSDPSGKTRSTPRLQGESDTSDSTTQSAYAASLANVIAKPRADGFNAPWLVGLCSYNGTTTSSAVRTAQSGIVNGTDIFQGGDTDSLTGSDRGTGGNAPHFSDAGATSAAAIWATAIEAAL